MDAINAPPPPAAFAVLAAAEDAVAVCVRASWVCVSVCVCRVFCVCVEWPFIVPGVRQVIRCVWCDQVIGAREQSGAKAEKQVRVDCFLLCLRPKKSA